MSEDAELTDEELSPKEQVLVMIQALKSETMMVRVTAAHHLSEMGDRAILPLIDALKGGEDTYWSVRTASAEALGILADKRALKPMGEYLLQDEENEFRAKVAESLGVMGPKAKSAVKNLITALGKDDFWETRKNAATSLGQIGDPNAVKPLLTALKDDPSYDVRRASAEALGELKDKKASAGLVAAFEDDNEGVRARVSEALGKIKDRKTIIPLIETLHSDASLEVVEAIKKAIVEFSEDVIKEEILVSVEGIENAAIPTLRNLLFHAPTFEELSLYTEGLKEPIIERFTEELESIIAKVIAVTDWVTDGFGKLASLFDIQAMKEMEKEIKSNENLLAGVNFYQFRRDPWVHEEMFFDLEKAQRAHEYASTPLLELKEALRRRLRDIEMGILVPPSVTEE